MNIACFLHSRKQSKDQKLPLPLAPTYSLPHHRWYFSSPSLIPLRKRKQNSSLYKYLQDGDIALTEQLMTNGQEKSNQQKSLLCVYQKNNYLHNQLKHMFKTIWPYCTEEVQKDKIRCECSFQPQESTISFTTTSKTIHRHLYSCKNNKGIPKASPKPKDENINWFQFAQLLVHEHTPNSFFSDDQLHLFRLPEGSTPSSSVFNILWNSSYMVFNNGKQTSINQHMKAKAVELAQIINTNLEEYVWKNVQEMIESSVDEIIDHDTFISKARKIVKIHSFRIWFYKKDSNNQLYTIGLSDVTFKGVECMLYKDISFKDVEKKPLELPLLDFVEGETPQNKDFHFLMHKIKAYSLHTKSNNSLNSLSFNKQRLKLLAEENINTSKTLNLNSPKAIKEEVTQIQCQCCKMPLLSTQIVNQITAKHIQEIRYLRQIKIGKKQFQPYDFVKVCSQCYDIYLKNYKSMATKNNNTKKTLNFYQYKQKKQQISFLEKPLQVKYYKEEQSNTMTKNTSRKMLRNRSYNSRPKSQFEPNKEKVEFESIENIKRERRVESLNREKIDLESIERKNKERIVESLNRGKRGVYTSLQNKNKKTKTTYTSNSETVDAENNRVAVARPEVKLERILTDHQSAKKDAFTSIQDPIVKSSSNRMRGKHVPKYHNIINRIILNSQASQTSEQIDETSSTEEVVEPKNKILSHAIEEYETQSRPSYKKLLYKNPRKLNKIEGGSDLNVKEKSNYRNMKKKSVHSYYEH